MSKTIDYNLRDRAAESLAIKLDVTFKRANEILEAMDKEAKKN